MCVIAFVVGSLVRWKGRHVGVECVIGVRRGLEVMDKRIRKFTDEEFMIVYNDDLYMSDRQMAKTLDICYKSIWTRRIKLGLKAKSRPTVQKTIKELRRTVARTNNRQYLKRKERISRYNKEYYLKHKANSKGL